MLNDLEHPIKIYWCVQQARFVRMSTGHKHVTRGGEERERGAPFSLFYASSLPTPDTIFLSCAYAFVQA